MFFLLSVGLDLLIQVKARTVFFAPGIDELEMLFGEVGVELQDELLEGDLAVLFLV